MKFIKGHNRAQINLFPVSLEHAIDEDKKEQIRKEIDNQNQRKGKYNQLKKNLSSFFERFLNWLKFDQNLFEMEGF